MHATFFQRYRIGGYFIGAVFFLWLGYWVKERFVFLDSIPDNNLLLILQKSPYISLSFPLWSANLIAGVLLFGTLLLIVPIRRILRQQRLNFTIFSILLLICILPLHAHFDTQRFNSEVLTSISYRLILCSLGTVLLFRGLVEMRLTTLHTRMTQFFHSIYNIRSRLFLIGLFTNCVLICVFISLYIFDGVPGYLDSCVYMFQARMFANGMLFATPPPEPEFFHYTQTIISDKWYAVYPPGYPAILALGVLFGISWLVNPLLGALTIVCIYLLAKELYGDNTAKLSSVLACASSFFIFMSSEFMSHSLALFLVTLTFLSFVWLVKKKRPLLSAVVCGICIGIALLCRPYTTVWICIPLGIAAIVVRKELSLRHILIGFIPIIVACLAFLGYNYATTGDPLLFGYIALHGKGHYPGFHQDPWTGKFHTVAQGFMYAIGNLNALNYYLFEWPIPALLFVCVFLAYGKKRFWEWLLVGWIGALLVGHIFYFYNQLSFGPRFVYEGLPALILLTSRGLSLSTEFIMSRWRTLSYAHARNILCLTLIGLFLFAYIFNMPATTMPYQNYGGDVIIQKYLDKTDVEQALVFVNNRRAHLVHYPYNAPFAKPHIYAIDRGSENKKLAEKFPGYRYFMAKGDKIIEVSIDELQQNDEP